MPTKSHGKMQATDLLASATAEVPGRVVPAHTLDRSTTCYRLCHVFHAKSTSRDTRSTVNLTQLPISSAAHGPPLAGAGRSALPSLKIRRSNSVVCSNTFRTGGHPFLKRPQLDGAGSTFLRQLPPQIAVGAYFSLWSAVFVAFPFSPDSTRYSMQIPAPDEELLVGDLQNTFKWLPSVSQEKPARSRVYCRHPRIQPLSLYSRYR